MAEDVHRVMSTESVQTLRVFSLCECSDVGSVYREFWGVGGHADKEKNRLSLFLL